MSSLGSSKVVRLLIDFLCLGKIKPPQNRKCVLLYRFIQLKNIWRHLAMGKLANCNCVWTKDYEQKSLLRLGSFILKRPNKNA